MKSRGFTLVEAVIALAILGITIAAVLPAFIDFLDANSLSEERSNAVAAAQQVMEELRQVDPGSLPSSGSSAVQTVTTGNHEYEVTAHYCRTPSYCSTAGRHIVLEVNYGGKTVYTIETVYTRLH
jgi:prepilin-type N-terminal cleavage/methylation domain-containing protein